MVFPRVRAGANRAPAPAADHPRRRPQRPNSSSRGLPRHAVVCISEIKGRQRAMSAPRRANPLRRTGAAALPVVDRGAL